MSQEDDIKGDGPREYMVLTPELFHQKYTDDEIRLFDLWAVIVRKRNLVLGVLAVAIAASVVISFFLPPVYQASIHFRAPYNRDIESLNIPNFSSGYKAEDIFIEFQNNFIARDNLRRFFIDKQLYSTYLDEMNPEDSHINKAFESYFMKDIVLNKSKVKEENTKFIHATLDWKNPADGAALLNEYSELILEKTIQQYIDELQSKLLLDRARIQEQIALLRASEKRVKKNRLAELEENISIARELGFERSRSLEEQIIPEVSVNVLEDQPLYHQGYEVLEAEKRALLTRKDNDPFIDDLESNLKKLDYLNTIEIPVEALRAAHITQKALVASKPVKPNKLLIVLLGAIAGLVIVLVWTYISEYMLNKKYIDTLNK